MYKKVYLVMLFCSMAIASEPNALESLLPKPLRLGLGPYAQFTSPDSVDIYWQTIKPSVCILEYGLDETFNNHLEQISAKTAHKATIKGLRRGAVYNYRIKELKGSKEESSRIYTLETEFNYTVDRLENKLNPYSESADAGRYTKTAEYIIEQTGITKGYGLILGCGRGQLAYELAKKSDLHLICVDTSPPKINQATALLRQASLYGTRVTIFHIDSYAQLPFTRYFADLVVSENAFGEGKCPSLASEVYRVLRPDGGTVFIGQPKGTLKPLSKSTLQEWLSLAELNGNISDDAAGVWLKMVRPALAGAGRWTHQYADPDNSAQSLDTLEGATGTTDLEVQWIGRPGANFGIDRNPRMPAPLSVKGRLFHQGLNRMIALNAYNGAVLWSLEIPDLRRVNMPRDCGNWCTDGDTVYTAITDKCWLIDGYTGRLKTVYELPVNPRKDTYDWGYIACVADTLYGSAVKKGSIYTDFWGGESWYDATSGAGTEKVCSDYLFALDKEKGKRIWTYKDGAVINATITIGADGIFFAESRNPQLKQLTTGRIGSPVIWQDLYIVALDRNRGIKMWEKKIDITEGIVFYGQYARGLFIITTSYGGDYYLYAFGAEDGADKWNAGHKWASDNHSGHIQHPAVVGNNIYVEPCGYNLETGEKVADNIGDRSGCATRAGTAAALIYRGADREIAMWDVNTRTVTSWNTLRPSCWLSTIAAGGMLLSPEGGGGCSCGRWFETSLGFAAKSKSSDN